jgi:hypothetical protein
MAGARRRWWRTCRFAEEDSWVNDKTQDTTTSPPTSTAFAATRPVQEAAASAAAPARRPKRGNCSYFPCSTSCSVPAHRSLPLIGTLPFHSNKSLLFQQPTLPAPLMTHTHAHERQTLTHTYTKELETNTHIHTRANRQTHKTKMIALVAHCY